MKVRELKGYNSYLAFQAYHGLMLGLKMLPSYIGESYEDFFARVELMSLEEQEKLIREATLFVPIDVSSLTAMLGFVEDPNGIPYGAHNLSNLSPVQIYEAIVAVSAEISKIKIDFVTADEKKNSEISQSTFGKFLQKILALLWPRR